ncbi:MAG: DUF3887 domain-containing protein [Solirubrobacteraceae bacterium]
MEDVHSPLRLDREVMALMLTSNVQLVADVLRADEQDESQVMRAIAATRSLDALVEETLRGLVEQARAAGHTWAEIGELLHVSRQAAFQRFGGAPRSTAADAAVSTPVDGAVEHAMPVLEAFLDGRFEDARARFSARMLQAVSLELLAEVREKVRREAGEVQAIGTPRISVHDGYTVVDIPVALERADGIGRVALDVGREVAGFLVRPAGAIA